MKHFIRGLIVVALFGGLIYFAWLKYYNFLTSGMRPTDGVVRLNQIEKEGAPDFEILDNRGRSVRLSDYKDRVVILSFWASWCEPCVTEFPSMLKLVDFFQGKVVLIAVSADRTEEDMNLFLETFPGSRSDHVVVIWDKDRKVAQAYGTEVLPESFVFKKGLELFRKVAGAEDWFSPGAVQLFHELSR